ncbi:MAG: lysylphosphatidylglycerol synthase transmembrane domain-containing protein [Thermoanaerobaculia bacterium]
MDGESNRMTSRAWRVAKVMIGIGLLWWLLATVDLTHLAYILESSNPIWLAFGALAYVIATTIAMARTYFIFRHTSLAPWEAVRIAFGGYFFNQILPTGFGGDAYRSIHLKPHARNWTAAIGGILFERFAGAATLLLPTICAGFLNDHSRELMATTLKRIPGIVTITGMLVTAGTALIILSWRSARQRIQATCTTLRTAAATLGYYGIAVVFTLSAGSHAFRIIGAAAFLYAVGHSVSLIGMIVAMGMTTISSLVPISAGALGIREAVFSYVLRLYGVPLPAGLTVALLQRFVVILFAVAGGVYLLRGQRQPR